ncbi:uncharacterized protein METZ01_LOCUS238134, partial [marine metagenome]
TTAITELKHMGTTSGMKSKTRNWLNI